MAKTDNKNSTFKKPEISLDNLYRNRLPPQNLEAEEAVLGGILLRPQALFDIVDLIKSDSFYSEKNSLIFTTMKTLMTNHEPIDLLTITAKLKDLGVLEFVGGTHYLSKLTESTHSSAHIEHYAKIVAEKATHRNLIEAGAQITELGFIEDKTLGETINDAEKIFSQSVESNHVKHKFIGISDILPEAFAALERLSESPDAMRGVSTGFAALDLKLSGLQRSDLIILAARPSVGKTTLAMDIARNAAVNAGASVGIFSLEMSSEQLINRMLSSQSKVDGWKIRNGNLSPDDYEKIQEAMAVLSKAPIFIEDQPGNTILNMRSAARRLKREHGLDLIIVDYLQLINPERKTDNVVQQVTEISRSLKELARELDVPVVALSQLSRQVESRGGKPRLSDLRDSGSIEQDADVVMFIHREDKSKDESERTNIAEILIEKHRNGPTGMVELYFNGKNTTFEDIIRDRGYEDTGGGGHSGVGVDFDEF